MDFSPLAFVAIFYWLALSAWFGAALFVTVAAPVVFRTVQEADPTLPTVLSVNLEGQHSTLLAARIVANFLGSLARIEIAAGGTIAVCLAAEWVAAIGNERNVTLIVLRTMLFIAAVAFALYGSRSVRPRAEAARQEYVDHADEPEVANAAIDRFDALHRESVLFLLLTLFSLVGLIIFSAVSHTAGIRESLSFGG